MSYEEIIRQLRAAIQGTNRSLQDSFIELLCEYGYDYEIERTTIYSISDYDGDYCFGEDTDEEQDYNIHDLFNRLEGTELWDKFLSYLPPSKQVIVGAQAKIPFPDSRRAA